MQNFQSAVLMDNGTSQPGPSRLHAPIDLPEADNKTVELLSKFFLANGIPLEASEDPTFKELMTHLNSRRVIPTEKAMSDFVAQGKTTKVNWHKISGPVSVTVDVETRTEEKYLAISVQYFENFNEKKTVVYFRKLIPNVIEANNILKVVRMAVSHPAFTKLQFEHLVLPTSSIHSHFLECHRDSKMVHVCFYHQMSIFVSKLLKNTSFVSLLGTLQVFMRKIRDDESLCAKFMRFATTQDVSSELPVYEVGGWESCYVFLTQCVAMHDTFKTFHERFQGPTYLTSQAFSTLTYYQRLLHKCIQICCDLNHPDNTISSVIPAITQLRNHISTETPPLGESTKARNAYSSRIQKIVDSSFSEVLSGRNQVYYECATLLDPRFAYTDEYFKADKWTELENRVLSDLDSNVFNQMASEFSRYRTDAFTHRPEPSGSPLLWWAARLDTLKHLSWEARDYLSCPAISVDAGFFLSKEGGKLSHLLKHHTDHRTQEETLAMAGAQQKFQGKGGACKRIMDQIRERQAEIYDGVRVLSPKSKKNAGIRPNITDPHFNEIDRNFDEERKPQHLLNHEEPTIKQEPMESMTTTHMDTVVKIEVPEGFMSSGDYRRIKEEVLDDFEEPNGEDEDSTVTQEAGPSSSNGINVQGSSQKRRSGDGILDSNIAEPNFAVPQVKKEREECVSSGLEQESSLTSWAPFLSPPTGAAFLGAKTVVVPKTKGLKGGRRSQAGKNQTSPKERQVPSQDVHENGNSQMAESVEAPVSPTISTKSTPISGQKLKALDLEVPEGSPQDLYSNGDSEMKKLPRSPLVPPTVFRAETTPKSDQRSNGNSKVPKNGSSLDSYPNGNPKSTQMTELAESAEPTEPKAIVAKPTSKSDRGSRAVKPREMPEDQDSVPFTQSPSRYPILEFEFSPPQSVQQASRFEDDTVAQDTVSLAPKSSRTFEAELDLDTSTEPQGSVAPSATVPPAAATNTSPKIAGAGINFARREPENPAFQASSSSSQLAGNTLSPTTSTTPKSRVAGAGINCSRPNADSLPGEKPRWYPPSYLPQSQASQDPRLMRESLKKKVTPRNQKQEDLQPTPIPKDSIDQIIADVAAGKCSLETTKTRKFVTPDSRLLDDLDHDFDQSPNDKDPQASTSAATRSRSRSRTPILDGLDLDDTSSQEPARSPGGHQVNSTPKYDVHERPVYQVPMAMPTWRQPLPVTVVRKPLYYPRGERNPDAAKQPRTVLAKNACSVGKDILVAGRSVNGNKTVTRVVRKVMVAKKREESRRLPEKKPMAADHSMRRRYINLKCSICDISAMHYVVEKISDGPDKLTVMVAHIHLNMFTPQKGTWFMKNQHTYVCEYHIHETVDTLYDLLQINYPDDIVNARKESLNHALEIVQGMQPTMRMEHVVEMFRKFLKDWARFKPDREPIMHKQQHQPSFQLPEETPIPPKSQRQPRKQRLENDEPPKKVVEETTQGLKTPKQEAAAEKYTCTYCYQTSSRCHMVPVPSHPELRAQWVGKLGADFERQIEDNEGDHFICKIHFVFGAFLNGELRDGALPFPKHVENAYEIVDGRMIKLEEPVDPNAELVDLTDETEEDWDEPSTWDGRRGGKRRGVEDDDDEYRPPGKQMKF